LFSKIVLITLSSLIIIGVNYDLLDSSPLQIVHLVMTAQTFSQANSRYQSIFETLQNVIRSHTLSTGVVLLEGPLSNIFNTSRVPVRKALQLLFDQQLISRFEGRGYLVNPEQSNDIEPIRLEITRELLGLASDEDIIDTRLLSDKVYDELYQCISYIILHGHYRLDEQRIAEHFNVGRNVVREALKSLHLQGLVEKEAYGDWLAGPLTAQSVIENYELRLILEPLALKANIHHISYDDIQQMLNRIRYAQTHKQDVNASLIQQIEADLHQTLCNIKWHNQKMANILYNAQSSILISRVIHDAIHLSNYELMLEEHNAILEALLCGSIDQGLEYLEKHLINAKKRSVEYLKVFSIIPEPNIPPYLERIS
jgi:hypothetical protein